MKKILSIIVLLILNAISIVVIYALSSFSVRLIEGLYANSRALFWVILIAGGSFGLGILWAIVPAIAQIIVATSQKIDASKNGLRYKVVAGLVIIIYGISTILYFVQDYDFTMRISALIGYVIIFFYSVMLILAGNESATLYRKESENPIPEDASDGSDEVKKALDAFYEDSDNNDNDDNNDSNSTSSIESAAVEDQDAKTSIPVNDLESLKDLYDRGVISKDDFEKKKNQLLGI